MCVCVCVCRKYKNLNESVGGLVVQGVKFPGNTELITGYRDYENVDDFDSTIQVHRTCIVAPFAS